MASSSTALEQALVGRRETRYVAEAVKTRSAQLKTLCEDIRDGRKNMHRFLTGVCEVLRPTKTTETD